MDFTAEQIRFVRNYTYGGFDLLEFGLDPRKVAYEVGPASHYWNGGIKVNGKSETNVPGLYAAGEVQGGTMGANRLSGNALTECLVFGALSGIAASDYAKGAPPPEIDENQATQYYDRIHAPLNRKDGVDVYEMRKKIQEVAWKYIGPIREETGLNACIAEVERLKKESLPNLACKNKGKIYNREWLTALENTPLLLTMEIVARASLERKESRGAMYRVDYPGTDNKDWLKNVIVKNKDGKVSLEAKQVVTSGLIKLPARDKIPYMVPTWKYERKV
jgi:succinate dehydrogenase/fumarate reductase flavoprotein subunit